MIAVMIAVEGKQRHPYTTVSCLVHSSNVWILTDYDARGNALSFINPSSLAFRFTMAAEEDFTSGRFPVVASILPISHAQFNGGCLILVVLDR